VQADDVTREQVLAGARALFRTEQAALAWYTLPTPRLGDTPRALVERGEGERVLALLAELRQVAPPPPPSFLGFPAGGWFKRR